MMHREILLMAAISGSISLRLVHTRIRSHKGAPQVALFRFLRLA